MNYGPRRRDDDAGEAGVARHSVYDDQGAANHRCRAERKASGAADRQVAAEHRVAEDKLPRDLDVACDLTTVEEDAVLPGGDLNAAVER